MSSSWDRIARSRRRRRLARHEHALGGLAVALVVVRRVDAERRGQREERELRRRAREILAFPEGQCDAVRMMRDFRRCVGDDLAVDGERIDRFRIRQRGRVQRDIDMVALDVRRLENVPFGVRWSADIVAAYVAQNTLPPAGIPDLIRSVYEALHNLGQALRTSQRV